MATRSNSGPAEDDIEGGIVGRSRKRDTSYSTRAIRDITYKVIPFCSFCLVIFSIGAIIASTFAFDKPIPRQGTIVISSILLSFFGLFSIGFMYLYFRKSWPHVSNHRDPPGVSRQTSHSDCHLVDRLKGIARRSESPSATIVSNIDMTSRARPRGSEGRTIPLDVLRDPAPSPNTYKNRTEEQQDVARGKNVVYELVGSTQQPDRYSVQQHERQTGDTSHPGSSNLAQDGGLEAHQLLSGGNHDRPIPASMISKLYVKQTSSRPDTGDIRKNTRELPIAGDLKRSPAVIGNKYQAAGLQNYVGAPIQQSLPTKMPQYAHRHEISSQAPGINLKGYEPSSLFSETSARSAAALRPPAESGKQRGREDLANDFSWPSGRSSKIGMQDGRELPRPVIQLDGNVPPDTLGKRPMGPRPMNRGLYISVHAGPEGRLFAANSAISNRGRSPLTSKQAEPGPSYQSHNDARLRRKSIPFNIASSLNRVHQGSGNRSPAFPPQTFPVSTPSQTYPRYPAAAPQPLQLPNPDYHHVPHLYTAYNRRRMAPQPRPLSHEPPIYEVEEEVEEVPKIPIRTLSREKMKGSRGGDQHRPRVPRRGSSRKVKDDFEY
ncbi:hypothetical protein F4782DRAFT_529652 [Xylaria castorea]|nr:hypothetical protein F4782DRAFT_529652 [Xylaria castorea]